MLEALHGGLDARVCEIDFLSMCDLHRFEPRHVSQGEFQTFAFPEKVGSTTNDSSWEPEI